MAALNLGQHLMRDPEVRFLVLGLRSELNDVESEEFGRLFDQLGSNRCWAAANRHSVTALVATSVVSRLPKRVTEDGPWHDFVRKNEQRVRALLESLAVVYQELDNEGVRAAAIEAGGVLIASKLPLSGYGSGDIDLLVDRGRKDAVDAAMQWAGFEEVERQGRVTTSRAEYRKILGDGTELWLAAGSSAFERTWAPYPFHVDEDGWLTRRVRGQRFPDLWVLEPTDLLLQVALHTSTHSYLRAPGLRLHVDVDRVVRDCEVDWKHFALQVREGHCATRTFLSLWLGAMLMATPVPVSMWQDLRPSLSRHLGLEALLFAEWKAQGTPLERWVALGLDGAVDESGVAKWFGQVVGYVGRGAARSRLKRRLFDVLTRYDR